MGLVKACTITFNAIIAITGLVCIGIGIWVLADPNFSKFVCPEKSSEGITGSIRDAACEIASYIMYAGIVLLAVGILICLVGVLGCCGAIRESKILMGIYLSILMALFGGIAFAGVFTLIFRSTAEDWGRKALENLYEADVKQYNKDGKLIILDIVQRTLHCCGANGTNDYEKPPIPSSCQNATTGCVTATMNWVTSRYGTIGIVTLCFLGVLLIGILASFYVCCSFD